MTARLAAALATHPWVRSASWDADREAIVVHPAGSALAMRPTPGPLRLEHLEHWRHVYSYVYAAAEQRHGDDLDLSGWRASDTGAPFDRGHMLDWIDHAVGLVLRGQPGTVLEVGCGSGLLAHRIHGRTRGYVGLDPAEPAVARLRAQALPGVEVVHAAAHQLTLDSVTRALRSIGTTAPQRIVFNSVTQCFPDQDYLTAVLEDALELVAPGGAVVVGDIRNLASAAEFAHWVEAERHPEAAAEQIAQRAAARLSAEEELLCDPRFFTRFARNHARDIHVACYAKPMRADTELTRYRYDVVLTVEGPAATPTRALSWNELSGHTPGARLDSLANALRDAAVLVTGIPNALLDTANATAVTPAQVAAAAPADAAVLLDSADAHLLAAGRPEQYSGVQAVDDTATGELCNNPLARFVRLRLPEILADHLEKHSPTPSMPAIVIPEESRAL